MQDREVVKKSDHLNPGLRRKIQLTELEEQEPLKFTRDLKISSRIS